MTETILRGIGEIKIDNSNDNDNNNNSNDNANKFGEGITFREGSPVRLLEYNNSGNGEFGQIVLNPSALNILKELHEPLAIISVVGSYRRGKSWFANVLHGRYDGFTLGAEVEGCTRGVYMWSPPFKLETDGETIQKRVIVLDSEGIDDPKQDQNWATKLFILCLAISSAFIYNINGIIGRDDIGKLCLMTDLSSFIQEPDKGDFLPRLVVLLRDFNLKKPTDFKDYFIEKLNNTNHDAALAIKKFFCDFDVYGLSLPGCKKKMLQHMEKIKTDELDEDFVEEVKNAVKAIYSHLPLKFMGPSAMKGMAFAKFLENIVERMNSSKASTLLSIPSEYDSVIQFVAQEAINEAVGRYKEGMNGLTNDGKKLPMLWKEFEEMHANFISEIDKSFVEKIIGSLSQIGSFVDQLHERLSECKEEFKRKNTDELTNYNDCIASELWEKHVKARLNERNLFENSEEFQEALNSFESDYIKSMMESPEAAKVIVSYKEKQYPFAAEYMTQLGKMNRRLAEAICTKEQLEKLQLEALARQEELRREIEALKHEREVYQRNVQSQMLVLESNIDQQKKSTEEMRKRLHEEADELIRQLKERDEEYNRIQKESEGKIKELQNEYNKIQRESDGKIRELQNELGEIRKLKKNPRNQCITN